MRFIILMALIILSLFVHAQKADSGNIRMAVTGEWLDMGKTPEAMVYMNFETIGTSKGNYVRIKYELKKVTNKGIVYKKATREEAWYVDCDQKKFAISKSTLYNENREVIDKIKNEDLEWKDFLKDKAHLKIFEFACD